MSTVHGDPAGAANAGGAGPTGPAGAPPGSSPPEEGLDVQFARLKEAGSAWVAVKRDQVAIGAKRMALAAAVGAGAALAAASVVLVSVFLLLSGVSDVLARSLELRPATAGLIVGGSILLLAGLAAWLTSHRLTRGWSARLQRRYSPGNGSPA